MKRGGVELRCGEVEIEGGVKKEKTHPIKIHTHSHKHYKISCRIQFLYPATVLGVKRVGGVRPLRAECSSQRRHLRFQQHGIASAKTHVRFYTNGEPCCSRSKRAAVATRSISLQRFRTWRNRQRRIIKLLNS